MVARGSLKLLWSKISKNNQFWNQLILAKIFEPETYNINRSIDLPSTKKNCIHISDMIFLFV